MSPTAGTIQEENQLTRPNHLLYEDSQTEVTGVEHVQQGNDHQTSVEPVRESDHGPDTDAATAVSAEDSVQAKSVLGDVEEIPSDERERSEAYVESLEGILEVMMTNTHVLNLNGGLILQHLSNFLSFERDRVLRIVSVFKLYNLPEVAKHTAVASLNPDPKSIHGVRAWAPARDLDVCDPFGLGEALSQQLCDVLHSIDVPGDGYCLYRALSHTLFGIDAAWPILLIAFVERVTRDEDFILTGYDGTNSNETYRQVLVGRVKTILSELAGGEEEVPKLTEDEFFLIGLKGIMDGEKAYWSGDCECNVLASFLATTIHIYE